MEVSAPRLAAQTGTPPDTAALRAALNSSLAAIHFGGEFPGAMAVVSLPDGSTLAVAVGRIAAAVQMNTSVPQSLGRPVGATVNELAAVTIGQLER